MPNPLPRLTRVLDALETHRLVVERDVSEIERAQAALVAEAERTRQRIAGLALWTSEDPRVDAALANLAHHTGVRLNAQLQHQVKRAQAHEREITDPARERRREANIRSRSVEMLVDRHREARGQAANARDLNAGDEYSTNTYAKKLG